MKPLLLFVACLVLAASAHAQEAGAEAAPAAPPAVAEEGGEGAASTPAEVARPDDAPADAIARVGDVIITETEFRRDLEYRWKRLEIQGRRHVDPNRRFRREILEDLINGKVLQILARNASIEVTEPEIQAEFEQRKKALPDEAAFEQYLRRERMTQEDLLREIGKRLLTEKFIRAKTGDVAVAEEQVKQEYDRWLSEGRAERRMHTADVAHIYARPAGEDEASWKAAEESIGKMREQVAADKSMQQTAERLSETPEGQIHGGVYHETMPGSVIPEISERIDSLKEGDISEPFKSKAGWHIMMVIQRNPPGIISFESMKPELEKFMLSVLKYNKLKEMVESAKKIMRIEIYENTANKVTLQHVGEEHKHDAAEEAPPAAPAVEAAPAPEPAAAP